MPNMSMSSRPPHPLADNTVLQVTGLTGGHGATPFFSDMGLSLPPGVSALIGDEGSGKTTLLRLLAGDLQAQSGQMSLLGAAVPWPQPQPSAVFWTDLRLPLNDEDTPVQCWAAWASRLPQWSETVKTSLIQALQLSPHLDKRLNMLSTGSRRKVGLVASLAAGATVTLLDQPFVSLDAASIRTLQEVLSAHASSPDRAWLIADYEKPAHIPLAAVHPL
jgi:ABC-type multidrug transport system ATPase subunit